MSSRRKSNVRLAAMNIAVASLGISNVTEARLDKVEVKHIRKVLDAADGNISLAARLLGLPRRTLQRKLKRLKPAKRKPTRRRKHGRR